MNWTDERVTELRGYFEAGLTAGQIAIAMGFGTRGPIVGKLHRLGLERGIRPKPAPMPRAQRRWLGGSAARGGAGSGTRGAAMATGRNGACDILGLTNETCRWPIGDGPPFLYCGAPEADAAGGRSYCPAHMRIAYDRSRDRGPAKTPQPGVRQWGAAG